MASTVGTAWRATAAQRSLDITLLQPTSIIVQCSNSPPEAGQNMPSSEGTIRKLRAWERGKVRDHLLRLSPDDRQRRFLGRVGDDGIVAYSDNLFAPGVIVLGCFMRGALRAVGELHQQVTVEVAEIAITVEPAFQNCGFGTEILRRLVLMARNRGIKTPQRFCLLDNTWAQKIAHKLGGALQCVDGAIEAEIIQPWPSCWSLLDEAFADGRTVLHAWWGDPVQVWNRQLDQPALRESCAPSTAARQTPKPAGSPLRWPLDHLSAVSYNLRVRAKTASHGLYATLDETSRYFNRRKTKQCPLLKIPCHTRVGCACVIMLENEAIGRGPLTPVHGRVDDLTS
jgi:GNAT superfamily N-acetyltransferase